MGSQTSGLASEAPSSGASERQETAIRRARCSGRLTLETVYQWLYWTSGKSVGSFFLGLDEDPEALPLPTPRVGYIQGYADALRDVQEAVQGLAQGLARKGHVADT